MKSTKLVSFTINPKTIEMLSEYSKIKSINKSALVDRLIYEEMLKETEKCILECNAENKNVPANILSFFKKYIDVINN